VGVDKSVSVSSRRMTAGISSQVAEGGSMCRDWKPAVARGKGGMFLPAYFFFFTPMTTARETKLSK
jgi:hypothetical protein